MPNQSDPSPSPSSNHTVRTWTWLQDRYADLWPRPEVRLLLAITVVLLGTWAFVAVVDVVNEGELQSVDQAILLSMRNANDPTDPIGPPWLEEMVRDWTALGGTAVIFLVTGGATVYLFMAGRRTSALLLIVSVVGAVLLNQALKTGFARPRPDLVPHGSHVYQSSFPSGHSMTATAAYLSLAILAARLQPRRSLAVLIMSLALLVSILVGVSRVYLGVHWPTDVLGGWIAGAVWALLCAVAAWWLRRSHIEESVDEAEPVEEIEQEKSVASGSGRIR